VAVIDVAVKATTVILAVLPHPSRAPEEYQPRKKGLEERRQRSGIQRSIQLNANEPQPFISP